MSSEVISADRTETRSMGLSLAIFFGGAAVGAIAALLFAPHAGQESRKQLREYGRRTGQTMREWATVASDLFAAGEKTNEAAPEGSEKPAHAPGVVKSRPQAVTAHSVAH